MDDDEQASLSALFNSSGDISKNDLLVHTRSSRFWKGFIGSKNKPCSPSGKVGNHDRNIRNKFSKHKMFAACSEYSLTRNVMAGHYSHGYEYDSTVI